MAYLRLVTTELALQIICQTLPIQQEFRYPNQWKANVFIDWMTLKERS